MSSIEAVILGIVQGLTEFLPVSSTAHLRIVPALLGWGDPGAAFTAVVQLGTMAAVLVYFRNDLWRIAVATLRGVVKSSERNTEGFRLGMYIILGTIPLGVLGLVFKDQVETGARNLYLIGFALIALGVVLAGAERAGKRERDIGSMTPKDAAVFGLAQALALIPGVSRSGSTISAGLFMGFDRKSAARYSFLLSVPAVVLSGLFELRKVGGPDGAPVLATVIATVFAFIVGWASIAGLLRFLVKHSTMAFVVYRILVGALVVVLAGWGVIS